MDLFFVLSGYLITSLLLNERSRSDRTDLKRFYARRLLRLAPLSILLVVGSWTISHLWPGNPLDIALPTKGALSVLFYVSNVMTLRDPASTGSLQHAWSLSIEEQFYLVWPSIVVLSYSVTRRHARWLLTGVAVTGAAGMALYRRHLWHEATATHTGSIIWQTWEHFYFGSFQRPDGLLIGCVGALLLHRLHPGRIVRIAFDVLGVLAAIAIALIVDRSAFKLWTPWAALLPAWGLSAMNVCVMVLIASLVLHPGSLGARALSLRPLCWVGRRAYGIYLIHPFVVNVMGRHRGIPVF